MNYYKFNIGDYAAATRHLTMIEHGAYRLLLDLYYTTEQPIPADLKAAARKAGARSKEEVAAVEVVLGEFFKQTEAGWEHTRCETEIAAYHQKAESNRVVGARGGRPKKKPNEPQNGNPEITQMVSENNPHETLTTNQEPRTINQEPIPDALLVVQDPARAVGQDADFSARQPTQAAAACIAMRANGLADCNPSHPELLALVAAGAGIDVFAEAARCAVAKGKGFGYVLGTVKGRMADAATTAATPLASPASLPQRGRAPEHRYAAAAAAIFDEATHV